MSDTIVPDFECTTFTPCDDNTRQLRDAFGQFATGVTVVTANTPDGVVGITASSFSSVSLSPPLVLWSPEKKSRRFPYFAEAEFYAIHVLAAEQEQLAWDVVKDMWALKEAPLKINCSGVPILDGCLARFDCKQTAVYEGGDHVIILGEVLQTELRTNGDGLAFFKGKMQSIHQD